MVDQKELLSKIPLFAGLGEEVLDGFASVLKSIEYTRDSLIVGQADPGDSLFMIKSGRVKVVLYGENGREVILTIFGSGDIFGEMSLLDGEPRSASVISMETTEVLVLSRQDFVRQLEQYPAVALNVLSELSKRLRRADALIGNLSLLDVYGRVGRILIDLSKQHGQKVEMGVLINERPTQQDLASMIGASRETVSRALSELQRQNAIRMEGKKLFLSQAFMDQVSTTTF
jgi:CRP/FNR family transcriptional regulator, cyclic AMP receptor protein